MKLLLSDEDKLTLERWVKSRATGPKQKQSAKIILMSAARLPTAEIMDKLQLQPDPKSLAQPLRGTRLGWRKVKARLCTMQVPFVFNCNNLHGNKKGLDN